MATGFSVIDVLNKNSKVGVDDQSPRARFRTKDISIFKMYRNDMNFYSIEDIEELAGEIMAFGLKQNLEVVYAPCEKGEYRIVAGERRWEALKLLVSKGHKEFEVTTTKLTAPQNDDEEQIEIIIANAYREKSIMDMIEEERRLKESLERLKAAGKKIKGYDLTTGRLREVIANMLKISKTKVAQIESVNNNLIPEFREEMKQERLTFSAAYELSGMTADEQREILGKYMELGELSYKDIKNIKEIKAAEREAAQIDGQLSLIDAGEQGDEEGNKIQVSDSDTNDSEDNENGGIKEFTGMNPPEEDKPGDDYSTPHPEGITSICYSCTEYETCNVKTGTCTSCDQYKNRGEENKTAEQRYSEEQDRIDKETAKKVREKEEEKKTESMENPDNSKQTHQIRIAATFYEDVASGRKSFELRKNDRNYKDGDILEMMEFKEGKNTGREIKAIVTYLLEDYTGIEEGYCIMGIKVLDE